MSLRIRVINFPKQQERNRLEWMDSRVGKNPENELEQ